MGHMWLKACPRCTKGDITEEWGKYENYVVCIQCGFEEELKRWKARLESSASSPSTGR